MSKASFRQQMLALGMLAMLAISSARGWSQSLGDVAREARKNHPAQAVKVYTNEDIPQWSNEVVWKSAPIELPSRSASAQSSADLPAAIKLRSQDVECSFSFRAQTMLSGTKTENTTATLLPASEVAKLDGTASIWGDTLDVSIHNDTGWSLREVTVRLLPGPHEGESKVLHSRPAEHGALDSPAGEAGRLLALQLSAEPHTATISSEPLAQNLAGQDWSWEIVQAKGIPPK